VKGATLFSGVGAPELAAPEIDWRWCAEIDPFASAVLATRFPHIRNLGDVTAIDEQAVEPVDVIVFGPPCQSFSVAGKRGGLADTRGDLAFFALEVVSRVRPRWVVLENVPGLLSSDSGRDFGAILGALADFGYGLAYRVLDAQYFGVPQRRRRVFIVGCLGDWRAAAAVLFERGRLCWDPPTRREAGQTVTGPIAANSGSSRKHGHGFGQQDWESGFAIAVTSGAFDVVPPLVARSTRGSAQTLSPGFNTDGHIVAEPLSVNGYGMQPRRLTPRECERLQGLPDDWTLITWGRKPAADGPRYRAIGNAMAVPVVRWILDRLRADDHFSRIGTAGSTLAASSRSSTKASSTVMRRKRA
jgi:DNA (cytosine-5)-methyltransferase 1